MNLQNIKWLSIDDIYSLISDLAEAYREDSIVVINEDPLNFIANLPSLKHYYSDVFDVAAVIIRTVIKGHP